MHNLTFNRFILGCIALMFSGCSLDGLVKVDEPEEGRSVNIKDVTTKNGALAVYASAVAKLQKGVSTISTNVGMFTDEMAIRSGVQVGGTGYNNGSFDARTEVRPPGSGLLGLFLPEAYGSLNSARVTFSQLRDVIRNFNDSSLNYIVSASYSLEGYTVLILAENFCSGIPLSKVTFDGTVAYEAGSSTTNTLKAAVSLFDSAQMIEHDSSRFKTLAQIGKGRAYLSLGLLDSAYASVEDVSIQDAFYIYYTEALYKETRPYAFWSIDVDLGNTIPDEVKNYEGVNGLQWIGTNGLNDPRVPTVIQTLNNVDVRRQRKYTNGAVVFPLARGIEKKMIEAEYWLSTGDSRWLDALNEARRTKGIQDTTDPGSIRAREDLLFRERGFWFYLEGTRLADYRRLVRQYSRSPYEVYPVGIYEGGIGFDAVYGDAFVFSPQESPNRKYLGCDHRRP